MAFHKSTSIEQTQHIILFGPQKTRLDQVDLPDLQQSISSEQKLSFLLDAVRELPSLWKTIEKSYSEVNQLSGYRQLQALSNFIRDGVIPGKDDLGHVFLVPLTVVIQAVEYLRLDDPGIPQGFCVGFLAAAAVASSSDLDEFQVNLAKALNLAVCIGATVDADAAIQAEISSTVQTYSVAWKNDAQMRSLDNILNGHAKTYISCATDIDRATITSCSSKDKNLENALAEVGITAIPIGIRGRYHLPSNTKAADALDILVSKDQRFKLPDASSLRLPLRSNIDGHVIKEGNLSTIALQSILCHQSRWFDVVHSTLKSVEESKVRIVQISDSKIFPRSLEGYTCGTSVELLNPIGHISRVAGTNQNNDARQNLSQAERRLNDTGSSCPIAVVGLSCRYPQSDSLSDFWDLIASGTCAVGPLPRDRFDPAEVHREPNGKFWGAFLDSPGAFDHRFFGISGREAKSMDPQQRLVLQLVYETLESAGYAEKQHNREKDVGCYLGVGSVDYEANVASEDANAFSATGTLRAFISGRTSHYFGWTGPSITFDTACSSSAVAIHSACKALQLGECSAAIAGGVNIITAPFLYQNLAAASFLNSQGASKAFDSGANGYCRGEGSGIVLLKPLKDAIVSGDSVIGVISGSAINQGSNCSPITVPDSGSQSTLYKKVLSQAGIASRDVSFVEAHGTGTPVGDPIEAESIRKTFGGTERTTQLGFGSVKDNVGHTEGASGVAGLIKVLLMIIHRMIPKQANFKTLNPKIAPLEPEKMFLPTSTGTWSAPQLAGLVNNYGAAGSNAAFLVQEYARNSSSSNILKTKVLPFGFAASSEVSLRAYAEALSSQLRSTERAGSKVDLPNIAFNLARRRNHDLRFSHDFEASGLDSLLSKLDDIASNKIPAADKSSPPSAILCFGGQTGKVAVLQRDVYEASPALQKHLGDCDIALASLGLEELFPGLFDSFEIADMVPLHCRLFAIQYATAKAWIDSGVQPCALIGHSFGQITALCVSGSISLGDALKFVSSRARFIRDHWGDDGGLMLSVEGTLSDVEKILDMTKQSDPVTSAEIVCYNGPTSFVIGGSSAAVSAIEEAHASLSHSGLTKLIRLGNSHAYHSQLAEDILPVLNSAATSLEFAAPAIHVETCSEESSWPQIDAERLVAHTRQPVYFLNAVERLSRKYPKDTVWLEVGSSSPIIPMIRRILKDKGNNTFLPVNIAKAGALEDLSHTTCKLNQAGVGALFWPFHRGNADLFDWIPLPPYQFEKPSHWIDFKPPSAAPLPMDNVCSSSLELIQVAEVGRDGVTTLTINPDHEFYRLCVSGHAVLGQPLCPASMYCELAIRAVSIMTGQTNGHIPLKVEQLHILSPLTLTPAGTLFLTLIKEHEDSRWMFKLLTEPSKKASKAVNHATGRIVCDFDEASEANFESFEPLVGKSKFSQIGAAPNAEILSGSIVYKVFGQTVDYAPYYQGVNKVMSCANEAIGDVFISKDQPNALSHNLYNPVALDNFLQVAGIHVNCLTSCKEDEVYVCTSINGISVRRSYYSTLKQQQSWNVYSNFRTNEQGKITNDIFVIDPTSQNLVATIQGAQFTSLSLKNLAKTLSKLNDAAPVSQAMAKPEPVQMLTSKAASRQTAQTPYTPPSSDDDSQMDLAQDEDAEEVDTDGLMTQLQSLLSSILEITVDEIPPTATLTDLGIDSLMSSEVSSEIQKGFNIDVPAADIAEMTDLNALCKRLGESGASTKVVKSKKTKKPTSTAFDGNAPPTLQKMPTPPMSPNTSDASDTDGEGLFDTVARIMALYGTDYDSIVDEADLANFNSDVFPLQTELVLAYITEAFKRLGCDLSKLPKGAILPPLEFSRKHEKAMNQYLKALCEAKIIDKRGSDFVRTETGVPQRGSAELSQIIIRKFPKHASEHKLLHTTGAHLAGCLTEAQDPIGLIFRDAKARDLLQDVYTNAPMFKAGTIWLSEFLHQVFSSPNNARPIRILELGGGTGGTTSYLLNKLVTSKQKFQYVFTDLSPSLVAAAKKKFSQYSFMEYAVVDIEKPQPSHLLNSFDFVISTNCIHATRNLVNSCSNIKTVLKEDGVLCLVELTQNLFWFDLVFGLLEGWWLFNDGREHALASPDFWNKSLRSAGFNWVDWTTGQSEESNILRVILASPSQSAAESATASSAVNQQSPITKETKTFKEVDDLALQADVYYPSEAEPTSAKARPVALMIHGGGHIMLSRRDVRPKQTSYLLKSGFLPISIDYRLCPEVTLPEGPMTDVRDALAWVRQTLPMLALQRRDVKIDPSSVVVVGWSTGGHLAMTLGWTPSQINLALPSAILAFYCPTDYESDFWTQPNVPDGSEEAAKQLHLVYEDLAQGVNDEPIVAYNPPPASKAVGGWMAPSDTRSRIALWMNWQGKHLNLLLNGFKKRDTHHKGPKGDITLPQPSNEQVRAVSPLAQIKDGTYRTPTFIVHGTRDDLIPWQQAQATHDALIEHGVDSDCRIVEGSIHLFDTVPGWQKDVAQDRAVWEGYDFLKRQAGL